MKHFAIIFLASFFTVTTLFSIPARADIYSYVDENGKRHYTNNPEEVPARYRADITYEPEVSIPADGKKNQGIMREDIETVPASADSGAGAAGNDVIRQFRAEEQALNKEFQSLKEERADLERLKQSAKTPEDFQLYSMRLRDFEQRFNTFHKKRKAFLKKVKEYNEGVKKRTLEALQKLEKDESGKKGNTL
ncbi:MAG: hypothetical protein B5M56_03020 [Desulfococcus sp. 4484_241]|nr:MAG: hypothetical protein B5M56_03020 [Desulfococcus sp. 4484_241]